MYGYVCTITQLHYCKGIPFFSVMLKDFHYITILEFHNINRIKCYTYGILLV